MVFYVSRHGCLGGRSDEYGILRGSNDTAFPVAGLNPTPTILWVDSDIFHSYLIIWPFLVFISTKYVIIWSVLGFNFN
jgi:hypothetical protein